MVLCILWYLMDLLDSTGLARVQEQRRAKEIAMHSEVEKLINSTGGMEKIFLLKSSYSQSVAGRKGFKVSCNFTACR